MKNIIRNVYLIIKANVSIIYLIIAAFLILSVTYFLGYQLMEGVLMGTDSSFAQTTLFYLDKWFPNIPLWYPYQGAGQSITLGYYVLTYYIPIFIHHLSPLTLVQSMKLTEFLSVVIIAYEIYLYCWFRLKNQTIGLIAALLYPLSSASWAWMTHGGFFAMSISLIFILPAFGFYDGYLDLVLTRSTSIFKKRFALLFTSIFVAFALSSHLAVGASVIVGMGIYTLFRSQLLPLSVSRKKSTLITVGALILTIALGILVSAAFFFPQRHYNAEISQDIIPVYGSGIPQLDFKAFLGIVRYSPFFDSIYQPMFLNIIVTIFAAFGLLIGLLKRNFMGGLGLTIFIMAFITTITGWINGLSYFFSVLMLPTNVRLISFVFIIAPILAAYGIFSLADLPFSIIRRFFKIKNLIIKDPMYIISAFAALAIFLGSVYSFRFYQRWPAGHYNEFAYNSFGPMGVFPPFCFISPKEWPIPTGLGIACKDLMPKFSVTNIGRDSLPATKYDELAKRLNFNRFTRTDVSVHLGYLTALANLHSDASMVNSYNGIGALIYIWAGHEIRTMFLKGPWTSDNVAEMAKYFGIKYVFLHGGDDKDLFYRYPGPDWKDIKPDPGGAMVVKEYIKAPSLASQFTKSTVLVIGNKKKGVYEQVFKMAYTGGLSIDQGLIVQGKEKVDDYNLEELSRFNALILTGYSYNNRENAYSLLRQYVGNGGSLFIDNGWQSVSKDWGLNKMQDEPPIFTTDFPDFFPVSKTTWGNLGTSFEGFSLAPGFSQYKLSDFAPLKWSDQPWSLAYASESELRPGAEVVLYKGDRVLVAKGNYGRGKIVWSGLNLISHSLGMEKGEEYKFINSLFSYLIPRQEQVENSVALSSNYLDEVNFTFRKDINSSSWVYFREAYTSDWHPKLTLSNGQIQNVKLYKAGPGLTLIYLPPITAGSVLVLSYNLGLLIPVSIAVSLTMLFLLLLYLIDGIFGGRVSGKISGKLKARFGSGLTFKKPTLGNFPGEEDE